MQDDTPLQQIQDTVRAAASRTLRIQGMGTRDHLHPALPGLRCQEGAASAPPEPLSMRGWQGVVAYEPSELVITVRAGTPLDEVQTLLAQQGQCLAFDPPHWGQGAQRAGTVGGMVATGLSGPARVSVGAVRDFVLGLEMINGQGQRLRYGGQVMKNVAGYDVSRLLTASWGTLGVITEVSLKVLPLPVARQTLRQACTQQQALQRLLAWRSQPLPLQASVWLPAAGPTDHPGDSAQTPGVLYLLLAGARAAVHVAMETLGGEVLPEADADALWTGCRDQTGPGWSGPPADSAQVGLWRVSLPHGAAPLALPPTAYTQAMEWHGALRWVWARWQDAAALQAQALQQGGSASLFRADTTDQEMISLAYGIENQSRPAVNALIESRLREAFDPQRVFAPARRLHRIA